MKRLAVKIVCLVASVSLFASCELFEKPDGECRVISFDLKAALNPALDKDIIGTVDETDGSITLVIPSSVTEVSFIPSFEATKDDVVYAQEQELESGVTKVTISGGVNISVIDTKSSMQNHYTLRVNYNDGEAELKSVTFKQADNSTLTEDVAPETIASEMVVRVPAAAFRTELLMTVEAGSNDVIKVNNQPVESGASIKVDTSFPIDITVSDELAGASNKYVVKVGKILSYVVSKLGSYTEGTLNDFTMTLNPVDGKPYFAYTRKLDGEKNNGVSVAKWNGSSFELVGATGIADASARSASKPQIAFAADGTLYAKYLGGDVASRPTVKKFNGAWELVGTAGFTPQNCNTSYAFPFFVHPATSALAFFWNGNTKNQASYRTINYANAAGGEWVFSTISGTVPAYKTDNSGMYYGSSEVIDGDKVYIVSSFNQYGYFVHEVNADGTLNTIVDNYLPDGAPYGIPGSLKLASDRKGGLYVLAADASSASKLQVYSVDPTEKTFMPFGAGIPVTISSQGAITEDVGFGVCPTRFLVVAVWDNKENIPVFAYLDESLQWSEFAVDIPAAAKNAYQVAFDEDGNGYIAYWSNTNNSIELYSVGEEEDILPE